MLKLGIKRRAGFTFVELMIALALNAILLTALVSIFAANIGYYRQSLNVSRLNQQMQNAINIMARDIRRAGYWANASSDIGLDQNTNPFMASATDITVKASHDCVLFTYDQNDDGILPAISSSYDDERYGYRLLNQALQTRPPGAAFSCTASSASWENMTDPNFVRITNLSFTLTTTTITTGPAARGISLRYITISMTGQLTSDSTVTKTITRQIRIRNDKFIP